MSPFLDIVDTFGKIQRVLVDDANPNAVSILNVVFERGSFLIEAVSDDDSLRTSLNTEPDSPCQDVSSEFPWSLLVGGAPLWLWSLTNQQGYEDGFQIVLRKDGADIGFQIIVIASSLKPFLVIEQ